MGNCYLWEIHLTFSRDEASYEGVLVDAPGGLFGLHDKLMTGNNEKELYTIARGGDKLGIDVESLVTQCTTDLTINPLKNWYPRTRRFQVQVGQTIAAADRPNYSPRPSYRFLLFRYASDKRLPHQNGFQRDPGRTLHPESSGRSQTTFLGLPAKLIDRKMCLVQWLFLNAVRQIETTRSFIDHKSLCRCQSSLHDLVSTYPPSLLADNCSHLASRLLEETGHRSLV
jgi:hypothetical protein